MDHAATLSNKILSLETLTEVRRKLAQDGQSLVQCHGCFDIVHPGHIRHLQFAAAQGDRLIVSITADEHVNKGPGRPMFTEQLRAENLAALEFVDWVYIHNKPTAVELLEILKPDIYIKGAEYAQKDDQRFVDERDIVESFGGRVVFSSADVVFSSSAIVESIQKTSRQNPDITRLAQLANTNDLSTMRIEKLISKAAKKKILVIGESIQDIYTHCHWPEIAQEHPMLSLCPDSISRYDGGAAVVALHLAALGASPVLCTPIPKSFSSAPFIDRMNAAGVEILPVEVEGSMPEKNRFLIGREKVMKLDSSTSFHLDSSQKEQLINQVNAIDNIDALLLTDFGLGMLSNGLSAQLVSLLRDRVGFIAGDVSGGRSSLSMHGIDMLCPCEYELRQAMNNQDSPIEEVAKALLNETQAKAVIVTLGADGLMIVTPESTPVNLPALSHNPIDVLGCGDALLAGVCISMLGNASLVQAAYIGSLGAAIEGAALGNIPVARTQIIAHSQSLGAQYIHADAQNQPMRASTPIIG